ncbi:hypothetical protein D3C78_1175820 [compost metagenome]
MPGFLIQLADTGILHVHLRNALHRIRRYQILAAELGNRSVGVSAQNLVVRLINLFEFFIRGDAFNRVGVTVFVDQHVLAVVLLKLQIDA